MLCQNVIDLYSLLTNTLTNLEWAPYSQIYSQTWNGLLTHRHTHKPGIGSLLTDILTNMEWTPCSQTYSPTWNGHIPTHSYKPGMCSLLTDILTNLEWAPYSQTWNGLLTHRHTHKPGMGSLPRYTHKPGKGSSLTDTLKNLGTAPHLQTHSKTWEGLLTYRHIHKPAMGSSLTDTLTSHVHAARTNLASHIITLKISSSQREIFTLVSIKPCQYRQRVGERLWVSHTFFFSLIKVHFPQEITCP